MSQVSHRVRFRRDHRWARRQMSAYLDSELPARAQARLDRHAAECPECRHVLDGLLRMVAMLNRLPVQEPDAEVPDIAAAVRRRLHEPGDR
jgi:anti-sigma factor RsiW